MQKQIRQADRYPDRPPTSVCAVILVVAGILAFGNGFSAPFVFDGVNFSAGLASHTLWPWTNGGASRGVALVTFQANYLLHGLNPWGYHAVNLAIHVAAALTLFGIVRRSLKRPALTGRYGGAATPLALGIALIWLVHPLQTQSVTYLVQRFESLMGLCFFLTLYFFVRGVDSPRPRGWFAAAVGACLLGVGCKETIAMAPLIVLWYDRAFVAPSWCAIWQQRRGFYAALLATSLVPPVVVLANLQGYAKSGFFSGAAVTRWEYLRSQPGVILHYLRLALWPDSLCLDNGWPVASTARAIVPPLLVLLLLAGLTLWGIWRRPAIGFFGTWFFLCLAPTSSLIPIVDLSFEHRMYLPLAAVAAATVVGHYELLRLGLRHGERPVAEPRWQIACLMGVMICCLGALTVRRRSRLSRRRCYLAGHRRQGSSSRAAIHCLGRCDSTALDEMKRRYPQSAHPSDQSHRLGGPYQSGNVPS